MAPIRWTIGCLFRSRRERSDNVIPMNDEWTYTFTTDEYTLLPSIPVPNLRTGVGHGHFRPLNRELPEKNRLQKARKLRKIAKKSKRRNRM